MVALFRGLNPLQDRIWRFGCSQGSVCERRVVCNFPKSDQIRLKWGQIGLNSTKMRGVCPGFADCGEGQRSGVRGQEILLVEIRAIPGLKIETWGTRRVSKSADRGIRLIAVSEVRHPSHSPGTGSFSNISDSLFSVTLTPVMPHALAD